jgi:hypothetical protein
MGTWASPSQVHLVHPRDDQQQITDKHLGHISSISLAASFVLFALISLFFLVQNAGHSVCK